MAANALIIDIADEVILADIANFVTDIANVRCSR